MSIVYATIGNIALIEGSGEGPKANNTFRARPEWVGKVTAFDNDHFTIVSDRN